GEAADARSGFAARRSAAAIEAARTDRASGHGRRPDGNRMRTPFGWRLDGEFERRGHNGRPDAAGRRVSLSAWYSIALGSVGRRLARPGLECCARAPHAAA